MSYEWAHYGSVKVKPGTTLQGVLNLYPCGDGEEPHLPLHTRGEVSLEGGDVWIRLDGNSLEYRAEGHSGLVDDQVCEFLKALAVEIAAEGWIDCELDDLEVAYGPSELARAQAKVESARRGLQLAQSSLLQAEEEFLRLTPTP